MQEVTATNCWALNLTGKRMFGWYADSNRGNHLSEG
jgi:hypothetical protein